MSIEEKITINAELRSVFFRYRWMWMQETKDFLVAHDFDKNGPLKLEHLHKARGKVKSHIFHVTGVATREMNLKPA